MIGETGYRLDTLGLPRDLPEGPTKEAVEEARRITGTDAQRLRVWTYAAAIAMGFPRRLGPEATPSELSADKKISKRVCHLYHLTWGMMYNQGEATEPPPWGKWESAQEDARIRRAGATVLWDEKVPELIGIAVKRIEKVESVPTPIRSIRRWQRRHSHLLYYELNGLQRIAESLIEMRAARPE